MRWQGVNCSEAEYERLFEKLIYELENYNVETALNQLEKYLDSLVSEKPA